MCPLEHGENKLNTAAQATGKTCTDLSHNVFIIVESQKHEKNGSNSSSLVTSADINTWDNSIRKQFELMRNRLLRRTPSPRL